MRRIFNTILSSSKFKVVGLSLTFYYPFCNNSYKCQENDKKLKELWCDEEVVHDWYKNGNTYWNSCEETDDGVLGGYGYLSERDIKFSAFFLKKLNESVNLQFKNVLDCGAGIGRVSQGLLIKMFEKVDLLEQSDKLLDAARRKMENIKQADEFYCQGMQDFQFQKNYDCVWIQWVSNQIKDDDYIQFLKKCHSRLNKNGIVIIKENISENGFILDSTDSSLTRSDALYKQLFESAGFKLILEMKQPEFPQELFDVKIYALAPKNIEK